MDPSNSCIQHDVKIKEEPIDEDEESSSDQAFSHSKNGWFEFKCQSGEVLFCFNIITNEHLWMGKSCTCSKENFKEVNSESIGIQCDIDEKSRHILSKDVSTETDFSIFGVQESRNAVSIQTEISFLQDNKNFRDIGVMAFSEDESILHLEFVPTERIPLIHDNNEQHGPLDKNACDPEDTNDSDSTFNLDISPMKDEHKDHNRVDEVMNEENPNALVQWDEDKNLQKQHSDDASLKQSASLKNSNCKNPSEEKSGASPCDTENELSEGASAEIVFENTYLDEVAEKNSKESDRTSLTVYSDNDVTIAKISENEELSKVEKRCEEEGESHLVHIYKNLNEEESSDVVLHDACPANHEEPEQGSDSHAANKAFQVENLNAAFDNSVEKDLCQEDSSLSCEKNMFEQSFHFTTRNRENLHMDGCNLENEKSKEGSCLSCEKNMDEQSFHNTTRNGVNLHMDGCNLENEKPKEDQHKESEQFATPCQKVRRQTARKCADSLRKCLLIQKKAPELSITEHFTRKMRRHFRKRTLKKGNCADRFSKRLKVLVIPLEQDLTRVEDQLRSTCSTSSNDTAAIDNESSHTAKHDRSYFCLEDDRRSQTEREMSESESEVLSSNGSDESTCHNDLMSNKKKHAPTSIELQNGTALFPNIECIDENKLPDVAVGVARNICSFSTENKLTYLFSDVHHIENRTTEAFVETSTSNGLSESSKLLREVNLETSNELKNIPECLYSSDTDVSQSESDLKAKKDQYVQSSPEKQTAKKSPRKRKGKRKRMFGLRKYWNHNLKGKNSENTNILACDQKKARQPRNVDNAVDVSLSITDGGHVERKDLQANYYEAKANKYELFDNHQNPENTSEDLPMDGEGVYKAKQFVEQNVEDGSQSADEREPHNNAKNKGNSCEDQFLVGDLGVLKENQAAEKSSKDGFQSEADERGPHDNPEYEVNLLEELTLVDGDHDASKENQVAIKSNEDALQGGGGEREPLNNPQNIGNSSEDQLLVDEDREVSEGDQIVEKLSEDEFPGEVDEREPHKKSKNKDISEDQPWVDREFSEENGVAEKFSENEIQDKENQCKPKHRPENADNDRLESLASMDSEPAHEKEKKGVDEDDERNAQSRAKAKTQTPDDNQETDSPMADKSCEAPYELESRNEDSGQDLAENKTDKRKAKYEPQNQDQDNRVVGSTLNDDKSGMPYNTEAVNIKRDKPQNEADESKSKYDSRSHEKCEQENIPIVEASGLGSNKAEQVSQGNVDIRNVANKCASEDISEREDKMSSITDNQSDDLTSSIRALLTDEFRDVTPSSKKLRRNTRPQLKCEVCGKGFKRRRKLSYHMRGHNMANTKTCRLCLRTFRNYSLLCDHLKYHNMVSKYRCSYCNESFISHQKLVSHFIKCSETKTMPQISSSVTGTATHAATSSEGPPNKNDRQMDGVTSSTTNELKCKICNYKYVYPTSFKKHLDLHAGMPNGPANKKALKESYESFENYVCNGNSELKSVRKDVKSFTESNEDNQTIPSCDSKDVSDGSPFDCPVCGMHFKMEYWLNSHVKKKHGMYPLEKTTVSEDMTGPTDSNEKVFEPRTITSGDSKDVSDEHPFDCPVCGKHFRKGYWLNCHLKKKHRICALEETTVSEDVTGPTDSNEQVFESQTITSGDSKDVSDEHPFDCPVCGKHFRKEYWLNCHLKKKHRICALEETTVSEDVTDSTDSNEQSSESQSITSGYSKDVRDESPFDCPVCGKHFRKEHWLNRHVKKKHGMFALEDESPFDCPVCGKHFRKEHWLNRHVKKKHGMFALEETTVLEDMTGPTDSIEQVSESQTITSGNSQDASDESHFNCPVCGKHFRKEHWLNRHVKKKHGMYALEETTVLEEMTGPTDSNEQVSESQTITSGNSQDASGESPFDCPVCGKHFRQEYWLNRHVKKKHGMYALESSAETVLPGTSRGKTNESKDVKENLRYLEDQTSLKPMARECTNVQTNKLKDEVIGEDVDKLVKSPLECKECGVLFKREFWYDCHMKKKHGMSKESFVSSSTPRSPEPKKNETNGILETSKLEDTKKSKEIQENDVLSQGRTTESVADNGPKHSEEKGVLKCDICNREFVYSGWLENHMKLKHPDFEERNYTNKTRTVSSDEVPEKPTDANLKTVFEVRKNAGKSGNSSFEPEVCSNDDDVVIGYKQNNFKCCECPEEFPHLDDLIRHNSAKHLIRKCPYCQFSCSSTEELDSHMQIHRRQAGTDEMKKICCKICGKEVSTALELITHFRTHKRGRKRKIDENQEEEEEESPTEKLTPKSIEPTGSSSCDSSKSKTGVLVSQDHEETLSKRTSRNLPESSSLTNNNSIRLSVFFCVVCNKAFSSMRKRSLHIQRSHRISKGNKEFEKSIQTDREIAPDKGYRYNCSACGRGFRKLKHFNQHKFEHVYMQSIEPITDNTDPSLVSMSASEDNEVLQDADGCVSQDRLFSESNTPAMVGDVSVDKDDLGRKCYSPGKRKHWKCSICGHFFYRRKSYNHHKCRHEEMQSTEQSHFSSNTSSCIPPEVLPLHDIITSVNEDNLSPVPGENVAPISREDQSAHSPGRPEETTGQEEVSKIETIHEDNNAVGIESASVCNSETSSGVSSTNKSQDENYSPSRSVFQFLNLETDSCGNLVGNEYKCSYCGLSFGSFHRRNSHIFSTHKMGPQQFLPQVVPDSLVETNKGTNHEASTDTSPQMTLNGSDFSESMDEELFNSRIQDTNER